LLHFSHHQWRLIAISSKPKHTLILKPELREELRNPLGALLRGTPKETMNQLKELIAREKPKRIIAVGDVVTRNMLSQGIQPHILIIDGKVMREETQPIRIQMDRKVTVSNPAGAITKQAWTVVEQALGQKQPTMIMVEGEEDLLTLVAVLEAPEDWLLVYGQPYEGVVAVKPDATAKHKVRLILDAMEPAPKS